MTVLTTSEAFLGIPFPNHLAGQSTPQSFIYPGAVQPITTISVLTSSEAFLGIPYPNHLSGQSKPQSFLFPGAVQPAVQIPFSMVFTQQKIIIPLLMTVPVSVTLHNP